MSDALPVTIILNVGSGHGDPSKVESEIHEGFAEAGRPHRIVIAESPAHVEREAKLAVESGREHPHVVVAAGGDGTLNLVASVLLDSGLPFGVIPLGTFNYFARDLGIPLDPRAAALALAQGQIRRVHVARVNGHLFLNNASFGLYRHLLEERERYKQRFGRYKLVAVIAALAALWRYRQIYTLRMELDGKPVTIRTPLLFLGLNALQLENLDLEIARCTDAGLMAVIALQPTSRWHILGLALRGALGGLHNSPDLRCFGASRVEVSQVGRRRTRVAVDGESIECDMPLHFEVQRDALQVLVPRHPEERK
ncbi:MAG: diacylglycerol kinase family protein [Steroidobacteraceae bacterium]